MYLVAAAVADVCSLLWVWRIPQSRQLEQARLLEGKMVKAKSSIRTGQAPRGKMVSVVKKSSGQAPREKIVSVVKASRQLEQARLLEVKMVKAKSSIRTGQAPRGKMVECGKGSPLLLAHCTAGCLLSLPFSQPLTPPPIAAQATPLPPSIGKVTKSL